MRRKGKDVEPAAHHEARVLKGLDSSQDTVYDRNSYGSNAPDSRAVRTARVIKRALNLIVKHLESEYGA